MENRPAVRAFQTPHSEAAREGKAAEALRATAAAQQTSEKYSGLRVKNRLVAGAYTRSLLSST